MISYFRFNSLPSLPNNVNITDASLKFTFRSGQTSGADGVCMIVTSEQWYENTLSWANQPYGDWGYTSSHNNYQYYNFYVCPFVEMWYYGGYSNFGIDFTYANMINDYNSCVSTEGEAHRAPTLTITYEASYPVDIGDFDDRNLGLGDYHWYQFTMPLTRKYTFFTVGDADTYGELYRGSTRVTSDNNSGSGTNFQITYNLYAGTTYYLKVRGSDFEKQGRYELIVYGNSAFNSNDTSALKSRFNTLLGSGKKSVLHYYTPSECIDIILDNDSYITSLCNTIHYSIPKEYMQALLMRELWCVNETDTIADAVVYTHYTNLEEGKNPPAITRDDSSTGYGQIFARTAIGALNHARSLGIYSGQNLDSSKWQDVWSVWKQLYNNQTYNLRAVYYEILNCAQKTSQPNYSFFKYNTTQTKAILSRYNGTGTAAQEYGEEVYEYYLIFSEYT